MQFSIFGLNFTISRSNDSNDNTSEKRWYKYIENEGHNDYHLITLHFGDKVKEIVVADEKDEDCNAYEHRAFVKDTPELTRITLRKLRSN